MTPRSRTGKLIQGLFGRFGQKNPPPQVSSPNARTNGTSSEPEVDPQEYPSQMRFDDDEETNWDDAEILENENNPILLPQPLVPAVAPPSSATTPDPDDWDEALPAATVKISNSQEARRGKEPASAPLNEDIWDDDLPDPVASTSADPNPHATPVDRNQRAIGLWTATIQQFRRLLPAPLRRLSDPLLTALVVALVTVAIWFVDSFALPGVDPSVANVPTPAVTTQPNSVANSPQISPEQAFIDAIQTQLSDITSQYPDEIVQTLEADFARDRLIVRLNPVWYTLDDDRQNSIIDRMWNQAKANHVTKLEIQDAQGKPISRSPVVGQHMIVLQRRQSD